MSWYDNAACNGSRVDFFPIRENRGRGYDPNYPLRVAAAKALCAGCEVRRECLDVALSHFATAGIWGGLTEDERMPLRPRLREGKYHTGGHAVCGTDSGYYHHVRWAKEKACDECKAAHSAANSRRASEARTG